MFNRFEWKNIRCENEDQLKAMFPKNHLTGKKIKALNLIGFADVSNLWNINVGKIDCTFKGNEPFVIVFDDNSTLEIQFFYRSLCFFSENQISPDERDGINHCGLDVNILFRKLIGTKITDVIIENGLTLTTDAGYSLKLSFTDDNKTLYSLLKNGSQVRKTYGVCKKALLNEEQFEIEQGHNSSSYFWIEPATELDSYEKGEYGVDYAYQAKISIDEDYVVDYLRYYLIKYFDPTIYHVCRALSSGTPEFEWNLEPNLYEYKTIRKMIAEIRENTTLIKTDFDNPALNDFKKYFKLYSPMLDADNSKSIQYLRENIDCITDFYERFCIQLELMMKYFPDYKCIDFMGP